MASHFLLLAKARSLSLAAVFDMTDTAVEAVFAAVRWAGTNGKPVCSHCACPTCYEARIEDQDGVVYAFKVGAQPD